MNYELAKKLKDAGYPQLGYCHSHWLCPDNCLYEQQKNGSDYFGINTARDFDINNYAYSPTLSELIEACGEDFGNLCRDKKKFKSYPPQPIQHEFSNLEWVDTPEEAVANLWLALNEK